MVSFKSIFESFFGKKESNLQEAFDQVLEQAQQAEKKTVNNKNFIKAVQILRTVIMNTIKRRNELKFTLTTDMSKVKVEEPNAIVEYKRFEDQLSETLAQIATFRKKHNVPLLSKPLDEITIHFQQLLRKLEKL